MDQTTSSDGEINVRNPRERHKQHKRQRKKAHKSTVDENSGHKGDGNCFREDLEEDGDNIDQQVAAAYEKLYDRDQRKESIFMETMEDYMKRLDRHSCPERQLAPNEQTLATTSIPNIQTENLEKGANLQFSMGDTAMAMYALNAVLRLLS